MRIFFLFSVIVLLILGCNNKSTDSNASVTISEIRPPADSLLLTDSSWGLITPCLNVDDLKKLYGSSNIKDERICGAECIDSVDVTFIYPGSEKEFIVYWEDSAYHKRIALIRCYTANAPYHTANGIKMGTNMTELLRLNGKPIKFYGFGWDYGGGIISLETGQLESSRVRFNLDISENTTGDNAVYGDTELNSDMPAVKRLQDKIRVSEIFLPFNNTCGEH